jgi:predicted Zn-dependent protease
MTSARQLLSQPFDVPANRHPVEMDAASAFSCGDAMTPAVPPPCAPRSCAQRAGTLALVVVGVFFAGPGCAPPEDGGSGPGHRRQYLGLSPEQEYKLGAQAYQQILAEAQRKDLLFPDDSPSVRRVRNVGRRIVKAVEIKPLQREINLHLEGYRFDWEFNVIRSREINAFCLPGGKVAVYTMLLRVVENDDQLATVLSHEIAHALAHHSNERITREESGRVGWLFRMAYDREQESEADHIGLFLMTFAGYDPDEAVAFWQRMQQVQRGGEPPEILSNHPSDRRRIQQLRAWVPQAKAAKVAYDHHRIAASR